MATAWPLRLERGANPQNANSCLERYLHHLQFKRRRKEGGMEGCFREPGAGVGPGAEAFWIQGDTPGRRPSRVGAALPGVMRKKAGLLPLCWDRDCRAA